MSDRSKLQDDQTLYSEAIAVWKPYFDAMEEDFRFALGDQWDAKDRAAARAKKIPDLDLNIIKKSIDLVTGYQRQNRTDLKARPIEGGDEMIAEVYSRILHWIMVQDANEHAESMAFKDAIVGGIGFIEPYMDFSRDIFNGDVVVRKESPFSVMIDPSCTTIDLSDADYMIRQKRVHKARLQQMYPEYADMIKVTDGTDNYDITKNTRLQDTRNYLSVVEVWRRQYEDKRVIVNTQDPADFAVWNGTNTELAFLLSQNPTYRVVKKKMPVVNLRTTIEKQHIVYDGENPAKLKHFPLIPVFAFFDSSFDSWELKLAGITRSLKDPQREKNKRRSAIMAMVNTIAHSGWIMDKGAVDDKNVLRQSAGAAKIIEVNPNKNLTRIVPPDLPAAMVQIESMYDNDIKTIGANPDLLGMREAKDPGVAIQLRQKQGITTLQEIFDNYAFAKKELGRRVLSLVNEYWSDEKIKRLLGSDMPWNEKKKAVDMQIKELKKQAFPLEKAKETLRIKAIDMAQYQSQTLQDELALEQYGNTLQQEALTLQQQIEQANNQLEMLQVQKQEIEIEEQEFWAQFSQSRKSTRFDIAIDETTSSPTYRFALQQLLLQWQQYGMPIHPQVVLETSDIPKSIKEKIGPAFVQYALNNQPQPQQGGQQ